MEIKWLMNDLFITQNKPLYESKPSHNSDVSESADDSITTKTVANETVEASVTGKSAEDSDKSETKSRPWGSKKSQNTDKPAITNQCQCICNENKSDIDMIRCNFCQIWFHSAYVLDKNDTGLEALQQENIRLRGRLDKTKRRKSSEKKTDVNANNDDDGTANRTADHTPYET